MEGPLPATNLPTLADTIDLTDLILKICNSRDKSYIADLLEVLEDMSPVKIEQVLQNVRVCQKFLINLANNKTEYLLTALFCYKMPAECIQYVARVKGNKQKVYDSILRMTEDPEDKIDLLQSCVKEGTSLNIFFGTRTGITGFFGNYGPAKDKLTKLNALLSYYQNYYPPKNGTSEKQHEAVLDDNQSNEALVTEPKLPSELDDEEGHCVDLAAEYLELGLEYVVDYPKESLLMFILAVSSCYYYVYLASDLNEQDELQSQALYL